jgi:hypothetical protein
MSKNIIIVPMRLVRRIKMCLKETVVMPVHVNIYLMAFLLIMISNKEMSHRHCFLTSLYTSNCYENNGDLEPNQTRTFVVHADGIKLLDRNKVS